MGKKERGEEKEKSDVGKKLVGNSSSKFEKKVFAPTFYYVLDLSDQFSYWNPREGKGSYEVFLDMSLPFRNLRMSVSRKNPIQSQDFLEP